MKKLIMILLSVSIGTAAVAQKPKVITSDVSGWHKIGETTVDYKTEKDEIYVLGADAFSAIKFRVNEAPIHLESITIHFESGDNQMFTLGEELAPSGESREIALDDGERRIKKVTYIYKTLPNNMDEKAEVELWGLKARTK